jgi:segregation and condensation protein A
MENTVFRIKTEVFEGPLELLLQLIEKRKLFISDVSLAKVTDDYIDHIKAIDHFPMGQSAQFILVASTLLLLKSRALLPNIELTQEEEESIDDLERRLKLYKFFQELSQDIKQQYGRTVIFEQTPNKDTTPVFSPQEGFSPIAAYGAAMSVLDQLPQKKKEPSVSVKKTITLEETLASLTARIQSALRLSFREFAQHDKAERVEVIVSFLAVLQLVKDDVISVQQKQHFDDIHLESNSPGPPSY